MPLQALARFGMTKRIHVSRSIRSPLPLRHFNAEQLGVFSVQSLEAGVLHVLGADPASNGLANEKMIQNIETHVPPRSSHRDEVAIDTGPQRQPRSSINRFEFPLHLIATPGVLKRPGCIG